jgi:hypothetical protein
MFVGSIRWPVTQFNLRTRFLMSASVSFVFLIGCSTKEKKPEKNVPSAVATAAVPYTGHGQSSVSAEQLQKFQAKALPPVLSRRIQNMLDVRSPGMGLLHPNKKELFFTWKVTGVNQVWKLASPNSFPQQMTGGEDQTQIVGVDPQGQFIVVSRDRAGEENPGLYLQPTQGGALEVIQHKPKVQTTLSFISEDGRWGRGLSCSYRKSFPM